MDINQAFAAVYGKKALNGAERVQQNRAERDALVASGIPRFSTETIERYFTETKLNRIENSCSLKYEHVAAIMAQQNQDCPEKTEAQWFEIEYNITSVHEAKCSFIIKETVEKQGNTSKYNSYNYYRIEVGNLPEMVKTTYESIATKYGVNPISNFFTVTEETFLFITGNADTTTLKEKSFLSDDQIGEGYFSIGKNADGSARATYEWTYNRKGWKDKITIEL